MTPELLLLCLLAALLELDTTYAFQLTFSRGIIAGPMLALFTGDWMAGIQAGVFTELLFSDLNPLGTILPPSAVVCCAVSVALSAMGIPLCYGFIWGVLSALLFISAEQAMRKYRIQLLGSWEQHLQRHPTWINHLIFRELIIGFIINFIFIFLLVWLGGVLLGWLQPLLGPRTLVACQFAFMAVPWIGLASLIPEFRLKKR
ncbi:MAG: PTS sugar transporter subunit IIC [Elusimicrobiaceae bacterium]|nr:PTS sugar transporter subunit IIC [Elusimicrobiaceae bacterium]